MTKRFLPGSVLGMLGSGQLGRMFALAAREMGYRVHVLSPTSDTPTGQVADREFVADYDDEDALSEFAQSVDVVSFEFENVPAHTTQVVERFAPVRPGPNLLHVTQDRIREKSTLRDLNLPVTPFRAVASRESLQEAVRQFHDRCIVKTATSGYDGKGQLRIDAPEHVDAAWQQLASSGELIAEQLIEFRAEVSVVAARGLDGTCRFYGPIVNEHRHHILDISRLPANVSPTVQQASLEITRTVLEAFEVVGVLCIEFFLTGDDELLINEIAPRPHNSGHLTIDACLHSQFAQQVRAICGLPLGNSDVLRPAAMANLLGDLWSPSRPDWAAVCAVPDVTLHLYGKSEARPGRKMGHLTALADSAEAAVTRVRAARDRLRSSQP